jgi:hypothetical protein
MPQDMTISSKAQLVMTRFGCPAGKIQWTAKDRLVGIEGVEFSGDDSDNITISVQDLTGPFASYSSVGMPDSPGDISQIAQGHFNADGHVDLWVNRLDSLSSGAVAVPVQILLGDGEGGFSDATADIFVDETPTVNWAPRVVVADFNHDGISDVFAADFGLDTEPFPGGQNKLFLSADNTLLDATSSLPQIDAGNHGLSVGDVNSDGHLDILVNAIGSEPGRAEELLINDGAGIFSPDPSIWPASVQVPGEYALGHTWSYIGDLNGDDANDIVLGGWQPEQSNLLLLNNGAAKFEEGDVYALPNAGFTFDIVASIKAIDLNNDDLPDLSLSVTNGDEDASYQIPYLQLLVNQGNGKFADETSLRLPQSLENRKGYWYIFQYIVDINGDGAEDILAKYEGDAGGGVLFLNDGNGHFSEVRRFLGYNSVSAVDVNDDGILEIVAATNRTLRVYWNDLLQQ